tara:strand:+ start:25 stop:219 length:195 start_codon:yes stop_codon:yes gene_type:complete
VFGLLGVNSFSIPFSLSYEGILAIQGKRSSALWDYFKIKKNKPVIFITFTNIALKRSQTHSKRF